MYMTKRTTIELDEALLERAKRALGAGTTRATVEEALRRAAEHAEGERDRRAADQRRYLTRLNSLADLDVLTSGEMWR
jgi:Arc/MetJ family transcription regulator